MSMRTLTRLGRRAFYALQTSEGFLEKAPDISVTPSGMKTFDSFGAVVQYVEGWCQSMDWDDLCIVKAKIGPELEEDTSEPLSTFWNIKRISSNEKRRWTKVRNEHISRLKHRVSHVCRTGKHYYHPMLKDARTFLAQKVNDPDYELPRVPFSARIGEHRGLRAAHEFWKVISNSVSDDEDVQHETMLDEIARFSRLVDNKAPDEDFEAFMEGLAATRISYYESITPKVSPEAQAFQDYRIQVLLSRPVRDIFGGFLSA